MIPKRIHYCWFGRKPLPQSALRCIDSWRKYLPEYEIKEWNEENFNVNIIPYTQQAHEVKKYAFVSDYARFWILYHYGGIYFDTDVEVIRPMDEIINRGPFMGIEQSASLEGKPMVAPGLGLGVEVGHPFYKKMLDKYSNFVFLNKDGSLNTQTIVEYTTRELYSYGMKASDDFQEVGGIWIYPSDYFCPMDSTTGITTLTDRSVSIHHYDASWMDHRTIGFRLHQLKCAIYKVLGQRSAVYINHLLGRK